MNTARSRVADLYMGPCPEAPDKSRCLIADAADAVEESRVVVAAAASAIVNWEYLSDYCENHEFQLVLIGKHQGMANET